MGSGQIVLRENPAYSRPGYENRASQELYSVVILDNDVNTYQQVIDICMEALGCDFQHAFSIALAVDHNGEAEVLRASQADAERVAAVIAKIGIEVRVVPV